MTAENCRKHDRAQDGNIHEDGKRCCHDVAGTGQCNAIGREEYGMRQIGKIRISSQKGEHRVKEIRISLVGEYREEEEGSGDGVENSRRAKLMRGVDGLKQSGT